ncbi:hypothetical protein KL86DYS1_30609 [uncultured Dysgonomonas sp.]|uniref:Uncharacterized protein n=1 Tax=uncultured Dysgonomonas sp. TaxID=206096 RepID=A0A212JW96_9BACT|nr:hypothetical protein KL86DYS1_30609 [uncultured Dysgonomonas sp.]
MFNYSMHFFYAELKFLVFLLAKAPKGTKNALAPASMADPLTAETTKRKNSLQGLYNPYTWISSNTFSFFSLSLLTGTRP